MKIIISCALPIEFNEARNQLGLKEITNKIDVPRVAMKGNIFLVYTGIGKINTIINLQKQINIIKPDLVIDSGTCGSLVDTIKPLDIICSLQAINFFSYDFKDQNIKSDMSSVLDIIPNVIIGDQIVASLESSVNSFKCKQQLTNSGASVVTWETSSVFNLCYNLKIPFVSIRGVTDNCNENTQIDFKKNRVDVCKKLYNYIKNTCIGI